MVVYLPPIIGIVWPGIFIFIECVVWNLRNFLLTDSHPHSPYMDWVSRRDFQARTILVIPSSRLWPTSFRPVVLGGGINWISFIGGTLNIMNLHLSMCLWWHCYGETLNRSISCTNWVICFWVQVSLQLGCVSNFCGFTKKEGFICCLIFHWYPS